MMQLVTTIALAVLTTACASDLVRLEVYYEALCPGCQEFITGPLTKVMAMPDIVDILSLKMVPYGNTKQNSDGSYTCQHGPDECTSDVIEQCTLYKLSGNITSIDSGDTSKAAFPFIQCMEVAEGNPSAAPGCYAKTMADSALSYDEVVTCTEEEEDAVQKMGSIATPSHDYVPWVLVDGELLENTNTLLLAICQAYTGERPESCKVMDEKKHVSYNNW